MSLTRIVFIILLSIGTWASAASPPATLGYQAMLNAPDGAPLSGTFDMVFAFYSSNAGGDEILIDSLTSGGGNPVMVEQGLMTVSLGSGSVTDGSGPGTYLSLDEVFRDYGTVYLSITINGEVLSPRTEIVSAAYALNADHIDGLDSDQLMRSDSAMTATGQVTFSSLPTGAAIGQGSIFVNPPSAMADDTILGVASGGVAHFSVSPSSVQVNNELRVNGSILMDYDGPDGDQAIHFFDDGVSTREYIRWDDLEDAFTISNNMAFAQAIRTGSESAKNYNHFGASGTPNSNAISSANDVYIKSSLEVDGSFYLQGDILVGQGGSESDHSIFFYNDGLDDGESITWDESEAAFKISDDLAVQGTIRAGSASRKNYNHFGSSGTPDGSAISSADDVFINDDLEVDGSVLLGGSVFFGHAGPDADQTIYFYDNDSTFGQSISWDDSAGRFEISDDIAIFGAIRIGSSGSNSYNHIGSNSGAPSSGFMSSTADVFIEDDLEVDSDVFFNGRLYMDDDGPDGAQSIYFYDNSSKSDESLQWDDAFDLFEFSDDLNLIGSLTATGTKSFVQNHPEDAGKSVVYVALEGDEAGTYTRGSARLAGGEARVTLGATYRLVTNPDLGLTAHLTARGECPDLYVESVTTSELVVRQMGGGSDDCVFDYAVMGLRLGWEEHPVVDFRTVDASVPTSAYWDRRHEAAPQLRHLNALERHRKNAVEAFGHAPNDLQASENLKNAIGRFDPAMDRRGSDDERSTEKRVQDDKSVRSDASDAAHAANAGGNSHGHQPADEIAQRVEVSGVDSTGSASVRTFRPTAPDLASYQPVSEWVEAGDVLSLDPDRAMSFHRARVDAAATVVGIVAADPGFALGGSRDHRLIADAGLSAELELARAQHDDSEVARLEAEIEGIFRANFAPLALSGIVRCKVDSSYGEILPGDLLVASDTPGHARSAANPEPGTVIGKALEAMHGGTGLISVLVMLR